MPLPPEIIDQTFHEVRDLDEWVNFTGGRDSTAVFYGGENEPYESTFFRTDLDLQALSNLRLVSRQWNLSANRLLRRHLWWNIRLDDPDLIKRIAACCGDQNASLSSCVRSLNLEDMHDLNSFSRLYSFDWQEFVGQNVDPNYIVLSSSYVDSPNSYGKRGLRADPQLHYDKTEEHTVIRRLFDSLHCIEKFTARVMGTYSRENLRANCYDMEGMDEFVRTIQYGLRATAFNHLTDLSLLVPSTWYVGEITTVLSQDARNQLRKLRLVIVDETGPGGSDWQMISDGDDYNDGDFTDIAGTGYAPSNIQVDYPNREHQDALWAFVGSCQRLESLAIIASHYLELDRIRWSPQPGYRGLVDLALHRIWTNVQSILKLLAVAAVNGTKLAPAARRVSLDDVKVYGDGGNWDKLFVFLRTQCPDLELFRASQLTYFTSHARHKHNNRPWGNWNDIWTNDAQENHDRHHLRMVDRKLINRGGSEAYCSHYPVSTHGSDSEWGDDCDTEMDQISDN
ncbi:unnamed protein product [Colletotrichum noveboracense]|uniref:Uncharacterized protein n=1 Tax=Colletotrichum noveboracense TaxID=2664923 RepID=A0A9W4WGB0_9PEZI|nr:unnamed protein product [Colletotrichum noveboracense]